MSKHKPMICSQCGNDRDKYHSNNKSLDLYCDECWEVSMNKPKIIQQTFDLINDTIIDGVS